MSFVRKSLFIIVGLLLLTLPLFAQSVSQTVGDAGNVDWSSQVVRATGIGSPNPNMPPTAQRAGAIESAKRIALRNLLEVIQGMTIDSETTVRNSMMENDVVNTRVRGVVRGFTVVDTKYMSTGDIEITVEMPISGALSDILLPTQMGGTTPVPAMSIPPPATPQSGAYTGLIVDAKGLGLRPAMAPKVVDENDEEIYGSRYVSREWAVQIGMVGYDKDVKRASQDDRVTNNPLVVKAVKVSGANKTDVVVSNETAAMIRSAAATQNFLDKCKVMFIVD